MAGIHCKLRDLGKAFTKLNEAMKADEARKRAFINEHRHTFVKQGFQPWMATMKAQELYREIHKNDPK